MHGLRCVISLAIKLFFSLPMTFYCFNSKINKNMFPSAWHSWILRIKTEEEKCDENKMEMSGNSLNIISLQIFVFNFRFCWFIWSNQVRYCVISIYFQSFSTWCAFSFFLPFFQMHERKRMPFRLTNGWRYNFTYFFLFFLHFHAASCMDFTAIHLIFFSLLYVSLSLICLIICIFVSIFSAHHCHSFLFRLV